MKLKKVVENQKSQKKAIFNIEMLYKARKKATNFFDDYYSMMSEAKNKAAKGTGLKILILKQIFQRLPISCTSKSRQ